MQNQLKDLAARLKQVEDGLAGHRDLLAVQDVLTRYSRALDWLDDEMLNTVFYDDAEIDYGFFKGDGKAFKKLLMEVERSVGRRWHLTAQLKIDISGEIAEVESYNFALAAESVSPPPPADILQFFGFYIDRLAKRDGKWGIIRRRHLLVAGLKAPEVPLDGVFADLNKIGATSPSHREYRRLSQATKLGS